MPQDKYLPGAGKKIGIFGVPMGFGAGKFGSRLGASAMRLADLQGARLVEHIVRLGFEVADHGDVGIKEPDYAAGANTSPKYLAEIIPAMRDSAEMARNILERDEIPVILGGDHSIAAGTFSGVSAFFYEKGEKTGLVWFDAHADMNTPETSPTGNFHGMPLATLLGLGNPDLVGLCGFSPKVDPEYCAHIGGRDLDESERDLIHELGMRKNFFTMSDIDKRGMPACVSDALEIAGAAPAGFGVTFDVDSVDPRFAPGSGTLVRGGITYREAHIALEMIAQHGGMRSFEIVEVNPTLDRENITAKMGVELILSALGKLIL